jgi:flagellar motor switch protein FliG
MSTLNALTAGPPPDISAMSRVQKLAALLIILGPETAAQILKTMDTVELEEVSTEMTKLPMITQELRTAILSEMSEVALAAGTALRGGLEFTQTALERALGTGKATDILNRLSPNRVTSPAVQQLIEMEVAHIYNLIRDELEQTIALVVSYLRTDRASALLTMMQPDRRTAVVERLARLEPSPIEIVEKVAEVLQRRISGKTGRGMKQSGGLKSAADVLNALNRSLSKTILTSLEEKNAELGQAIRQKMFTFEDLKQLDGGGLQKVLREVDMRDLAVALKKAPDALRDKLLACISKRAAQTVLDEMSFMSSVKLKEIEAAQLRIIEIVRRLEEEGEIEVDGSGEAATE